MDIPCVKETGWKGRKARSIGAGFKLIYHGVNGKTYWSRSYLKGGVC